MAHIPSFPHDSFLAKWLSGELSDAEWDAWKEEAGEEELQRIINTVDHWEVPATRSKDEAWTQFAAGLQDIEEKSTPVRSLRPLRWISVAAAVIVLASVAFLLRDTTQTYTTSIGGKEIVSLPDGSTVQLNANSSLSFDPADWEDERSVQLDGEAFFSVAEGKTFTVQTDQGSVSVLGTSFNVHDRPESWSVQCYTGKVEVKSQTQTVILTAGERAEFSRNTLEEVT
ncbi:MAG: FecR domain-containing protein, partial [Bacteroidota bacterium]